MIKSYKEMKNKSIHQSNLSKPPIKCHPYLQMSFQDWQSCPKGKKYALGRIRTLVKSKDSGQM